MKQENKDLKTDLDLHRQGKSIDPVQIDNLNECLIIPVSEKKVLDKLEDIRRHPAEYSFLFDKPLPKVWKESQIHLTILGLIRRTTF